MTNIEKKVLEFLKNGMAYSDEAIIKNIGIDCEELEKIYDNLMINGFLESYKDFLSKNPEYNESQKCEKKSDSNCGGCEKKECNCNSDDEIDYSKIKVLTEKAFTYTF